MRKMNLNKDTENSKLYSTDEVYNFKVGSEFINTTNNEIYQLRNVNSKKVKLVCRGKSGVDILRGEDIHSFKLLNDCLDDIENNIEQYIKLIYTSNSCMLIKDKDGRELDIMEFIYFLKEEDLLIREIYHHIEDVFENGLSLSISGKIYYLYLREDITPNDLDLYLMYNLGKFLSNVFTANVSLFMEDSFRKHSYLVDLLYRCIYYNIYRTRMVTDYNGNLESFIYAVEEESYKRLNYLMYESKRLI